MTRHQNSDTSIDKTMTLTASEFAKSMAAFAGGDVAISNGRVSLPIGADDGRAEITFVALPPRRIGGGLLELPQAKVTITLTGVSAEDAQQFLRRFDIAFQRGGG